MNTQIIAIANQKGGVGKTTTCANLGIGLAQAGKKVLLIDGDPQGSLTISLGNPQPDKLPFTLSDAMGKILMDQPIRPGEGILHHAEGVDLMPADIQLSGMEVSLVNAMSRETILRQYLDTLKGQYSHILIDCQPSLGMLTVNALAAANRIIIPVQAEYLPAKGLEQLLSTVSKVKRQINPKLQIDGILLTMVDNRTNFAKEIAALLRDTYGSKIKVFGTEIPHSVRAKEISAEGKSIFAHDPGGKVAEGYRNLTKEVLKLVFGGTPTSIGAQSAIETKDGGKTGLSSLAAAVGFFIAMFNWVFFAIFATSTNGVGMWINDTETKLAAYVQDGFVFADLIMVFAGIAMLKGITKIDVKNLEEMVPFAATLIGAAVFGDLVIGIGFAAVLYCIAKLIGKDRKEISPATIILAVILIVYVFIALKYGGNFITATAGGPGMGGGAGGPAPQ